LEAENVFASNLKRPARQCHVCRHCSYPANAAMAGGSGPQTLAQTWIIGIVAPQWDDAPGQAFNGAKRLPAKPAKRAKPT